MLNTITALKYGVLGNISKRIVDYSGWNVEHILLSKI